MKKIFLFIAAFLFSVSAAAFACEFTYTLSGPDMQEKRIIPGSSISLEKGGTYTLSVSYTEDHRNCIVPPEDTLFLTEEERWKTGKDYLALSLVSLEEWESSGRTHSASFTFTALKEGEWVIEVLRECTRGGYRARLLFDVA